MSRIAVVEDDDEVGELLKTLLEANGYDVDVFPTPGGPTKHKIGAFSLSTRC